MKQQFTPDKVPLIKQGRGIAKIWHTHPMGEHKRRPKRALAKLKEETGQPPQVVDTLGGRMHIRWDEGAPATPHGQLVFFAEFLASTGVFERWA